MIKRIISIFCVLNILSGCGYVPINLNKENTFNIEIESISGDDRVNESISNMLKINSTKNSSQKLILNITTEYDKTTNLKDSTGTDTSFRITVKIIFKINDNNKISNLILSEYLDLKRNDNRYEETQLENIMINNLTRRIYNKLINKLAIM